MTQQTFNAVNPATGETLDPPFVEASDAEVNTAAYQAAEAFRISAFAPPRWTADWLEAIADRIMALGDPLLDRAEAETALPRPRLIGERARTVGQIKMFAQIVREGSWVDAVIDTADPKRAPQPKPDLRRMLRPRGPVAVFGASNFPFAFSTAGGDTASALAAGCPVIVKGHPSHPGTSQLFADAIRDAMQKFTSYGAFFALLQGKRHELSAALVKHHDITAVGFTGSLRAGRALFDIAAARPTPIPVYAEMGSVNPVVIMPAALAERGPQIAQDLANSILLGGGQFCTKPGIVFTFGPGDGQFLRDLAARISATAGVTMLNQGLRENFKSRITQLKGAGGVRTMTFGAPAGHAGIAPSLFETDSDTFCRNPDLREEAFGPGAIVVRCEGHPAACIEQLSGSLTGTIHVGTGDDPSLVRTVLSALEHRVGRVVINGYPTGVEVNNAIVHGGPYPATTDAATTSVGAAAIRRWVRLIAYQDTPDTLLPPALQNANPLGIERTIDGVRTREKI